VEYSDTECPFCKEFHKTMRALMTEYGNKGELAWVYRHFPVVGLHSKAPKEAEALECAGELGGNAKFWEYANRLYEVTPSNNNLEPTELENIAKQAGLSSDKFNTCLESGQYAPRVKADMNDAQEAGGEGTPFSVVIDTKTGDTYPINGAYPYSEMKNIIDLILQS
jgi:protein-disulfide isomerase